MLKTCRLSRVYILAKGALECAKRVLLQKENPHARLPRTRPKTHYFYFLSLSPVGLSLEGFLGTPATDDFDLLILCPVYILIILLPDTFLNLLKEYFISSVLFHLSKLIKQLLFDIINLS